MAVQNCGKPPAARPHEHKTQSDSNRIGRLEIPIRRNSQQKGHEISGLGASLRPMKFTRLGATILCTLAALAKVLAADAPAASAANSSTGEEPFLIEALDQNGLVSMDQTGRITGTKGVLARGSGATLTARTVSYDPTSLLVSAEGDVVIQFSKDGEAQLWKGKKARFSFLTKRIFAEEFRLEQPPFYAAGKQVEAAPGTGTGAHKPLQGGHAELTDGLVTTDDVEHPSYHVKAKRIRFDQGKSITTDDATFYVGDIPVMHLAHYTRHLERHENFWTIQPGYRSRVGPFIETANHWFARTNLETFVSLDYRQRRGFAGGPGLHYDLPELGQGGGRIYYAHDDLPRLYAGDLPVHTDRLLYNWHHSFTNSTGLTAHALVNGQNDPLIGRDFFEREFRRDLQPKTFFELNQAWPNWTIDVLAQPQLISFYQTVERLPDIKLTGLRQEIGTTPVYYESDSSVAYLRLQPGLLGGTNFAAVRADTYHQLVLPQTYFGWLNFIPRVGGRFTYYGQQDRDGVSVGDQNRGVFNTGAEVNFKASKVWQDVEHSWLDVSGLRHIVVPSVNYVYVPEPSVRPNRLPQFDTELPSPRLLPIEFPDYNAVDSVDSQSTLRFGLHNKLQTKREGQVADVLDWNLYTDWRLRPRPGQGTFPDFFSDLDFLPRSWLVLSSETRYDPSRQEMAEANHRLTLQPNDLWHWTVGHRYLRDDPATYGAGNNLFFSSVYMRANENWGFRAVHYFESRDGRMEEQAYSVYRDFRAWTGALTLRFRDLRVGADDWSISVNFSLKAFPRFGLDDDRDRVHRLFGGGTELF